MITFSKAFYLKPNFRWSFLGPIGSVNAWAKHTKFSILSLKTLSCKRTLYDQKYIRYLDTVQIFFPKCLFSPHGIENGI